MRILVTGCNGQLGRALSFVLEERVPGSTFYTDVDTLDVTDAKAVADYVRANEINRIVNCAAYTAVDRAEQETALCRALNFDAVRNIAVAADDNVAKVIHISTDYVFDGTLNRPYNEADKVNPLSAYGAAKRKGETVLLARCPDSIVIRTAWLYSPHGRNFVKTMLGLAAERDEIDVVADQVGAPTCADDLAGAIADILTARQWMPGVYHYSNEGVASWYDFARAILRLSGNTRCRLNPIMTADYPTAAARPLYAVLDKTKIKKTYNLTIPHWADSLERCLKSIVK